MAKRLFDVLVALISLAAMLPVILIVSVWIKVDSKGPVLFRQQRVGRNSKEFEILKFRS